MNKQISTIELEKESMKFSIGHFTIFSETERENLHGHNYNVHLALTTEVDPEMGLTFDYRYYKKLVFELCQSINQRTLIPSLSKYLDIESDGNYLYVTFNKEKMVFLHRDVQCMQMHNISVEELAQWFVNQLIADEERLQQHAIQKIYVKVFSAPGQSASATYQKPGT